MGICLIVTNDKKETMNLGKLLGYVNENEKHEFIEFLVETHDEIGYMYGVERGELYDYLSDNKSYISPDMQIHMNKEEFVRFLDLYLKEYIRTYSRHPFLFDLSKFPSFMDSKTFYLEWI
jgi:hypothetical protein